jgi:hypothetical protein
LVLQLRILFHEHLYLCLLLVNPLIPLLDLLLGLLDLLDVIPDLPLERLLLLLDLVIVMEELAAPGLQDLQLLCQVRHHDLVMVEFLPLLSELRLE